MGQRPGFPATAGSGGSPPGWATPARASRASVLTETPHGTRSPSAGRRRPRWPRGAEGTKDLALHCSTPFQLLKPQALFQGLECAFGCLHARVHG